MKNEKNNIRDFLYDEPGPKTRRRIVFWTIVSLFPIAFLLYRMAVRFQENGQLAPQYWSFFLKYTTWRFIGQGFWVRLRQRSRPAPWHLSSAFS